MSDDEPELDPLFEALQTVWDLGDALDSEATRWAVGEVADLMGVEIERHDRYSAVIEATSEAAAPSVRQIVGGLPLWTLDESIRDRAGDRYGVVRRDVELALHAVLASVGETALRERIETALTPRITKREGGYPSQTITEVENLLPREALRRVRAALATPVPADDRP